MAANNFQACDAFTAPAEAGLSTDPRDPGNWTGGKVGQGTLIGTKYGIAAAAHPGVDILNLTAAQAAQIRESEYWTPAGCEQLPAGVDLVVYDFAVNAGVRRSVEEMQAALGVWQDGDLGPLTLAAAKAVAPADLITKLMAAHETYYSELSTFPTYGVGWDGRADRCKAASLAMVAKSVPASTPLEAASVPVPKQNGGWLSQISGSL